MTKYSNEFKVKTIKMVLKGNSISHVVKILNMPDIAPLCRWIYKRNERDNSTFRPRMAISK